MAAVRVRFFVINGFECAGVISAAKYMGVSEVTVVRMIKKFGDCFVYKNFRVESYLKKPENKPDIRKQKACSKCKLTLPNTSDYFRIDSSKVNKKYSIVLSSYCIECDKNLKIIRNKKRKEELDKIGISAYSLKSKEQIEKHIKRNLLYSKENREKVNKEVRNRRKNKHPGIVKADKKREEKAKNEIKEISDYYITRLIRRNNKDISIDELYRNKDYLDLHRLNLKIKRLCHQLKT
jgi:hypothetical protein